MDKKKFIILLVTIVVTIFVSIFFSFWFFFGDKTPKNNFPNDIATPDFAGVNEQFDQINKIISDQQKAIENFNKDFNNTINQKPFLGLFNNQSGAVNVQSEELKDKYKITVSLKPFNNDEKNVNVKVKGKEVTISAKYQSKEKNKTNSSEFLQTLTLSSKVNSKAVKREKQGDNLIISIPKA